MEFSQCLFKSSAVLEHLDGNSVVKSTD